MLEGTFNFFSPLALLNSWLPPAKKVLLCLNIELFLFSYDHLISYLCSFNLFTLLTAYLVRWSKGSEELYSKYGYA
jgi:hypothetical protein